MRGCSLGIVPATPGHRLLPAACCQLPLAGGIRVPTHRPSPSPCSTPGAPPHPDRHPAQQAAHTPAPFRRRCHEPSRPHLRCLGKWSGVFRRARASIQRMFPTAAHARRHGATDQTTSAFFGFKSFHHVRTGRGSSRQVPCDDTSRGRMQGRTTPSPGGAFDGQSQHRHAPDPMMRKPRGIVRRLSKAIRRMA